MIEMVHLNKINAIDAAISLNVVVSFSSFSGPQSHPLKFSFAI